MAQRSQTEDAARVPSQANFSVPLSSRWRAEPSQTVSLGNLRP
jgi:hypothetical protein